MMMKREEATSAGFCGGGRETGEPGEKNPLSKAKLNPHMAPGRNRTLATFLGGERSHHCVNPAPHN